MSKAKSKRQSTTEYSPESAKGLRCKKRRLSSDDHDEDDDRAATLSKLSKDTRINGLRTPAFTHANKPAELFRKDLISAMKLADSEQLQTEEYLLIQDPWRQDWEKGVQVPVNSVESLHPKIKVICEKPKTGDFKIPRKFLHASQDGCYKQGQHELTGMQQLSEQVVRYDLDDLDACWLKKVNEEREEMGEIAIYEWTMERVMEELEKQCHETMETTIQTEEGLGIEYDEDVICDVCRSTESEENNEMVFCDGCDICVHQACYGIQKIPEGSWLCRTCALGIKPTCMLCPKTGGAMKSTRSGTKWSHVSCALWIPEVSIGCVEKMEPITKISQIPVSRWALVCCLCKERAGACIQCSVKTCKIAFHVTCGISHNLDMKTILDDSAEEDGVKLKAFCPKHTKRRDRTSSDSELDSPTKDNMGTPNKQDLTHEEEEGLRKEKLKQLEDLFYTLIDVKKVAEVLQLPLEAVDTIGNFWKLKRKSLFDKPLLTPKTQEAELLEKQQEDSLMARMKMFVHLRQDLERVRNLCYMVSRREKMKRSYRRLRESVFMAQVKVLSQPALSTREVNRVKKVYFDTSCYRPQLLQDSGLSSDEAPSTSQESSTQPFSREGTPLSSSSLTSEPEIRKSGRRRILSCKLRDVSPVLSDSASQDGSVCASDDLYVPGYDSDAKIKTTVKRSLPVNGKLSLSRRSRLTHRIFGSDSETTETEPVSPDGVPVEKETENEDVKIDVDVSDKSEKVTPVKRLPFKTTPGSPSPKPSPNTRSSLRLDPSHSSPSKAETPLERTKLKVKNLNNSLGLVKVDSPKRLVKSRLSRTPMSGHNIVRKTRQTPSISPESVENKPTDFNNRLRDITPSPVKHKQFVEQLTPLSCSPVNDIVKKELKDVLQQSQLVIDEKLREEVEERLLKSASPKRYMNGVHGRSPRRLNAAYDAKITRSNQGLVKRPNSFNQALTPNKLSNSGKVLNEISPTYTRTGVENKDWFGTNTSPRGSLSGYKIPKKSNRTPVQSPIEAREQTNGTSPLPAGVLETRGNIRRKIDIELSKVTEHDGRIRRSADSTPDKSDRRLTRSQGHENIEDVLITGKSRVIDSLQMWSSNT